MSSHLLNAACSDAFEEAMRTAGEKPYRCKQIIKWIFDQRATSFDEMSDLSKSLRERLASEFSLFDSSIAERSQAGDKTEKLLIELQDRHRIECVLIRHRLRKTICISTQVGCAMGCVFCASGLDGVERNLTSGEIVEQAVQLNNLLAKEERLSHIVVMGMGEPLANLDRLLPALDLLTSPQGLGISSRRVTISTVGLPPAIRRLAEIGKTYRLAVSLHAPNDELRTRLVPTNNKIGIDAIVEAADDYYEACGRRLTYEYVLLGDLNDAPEHAEELVELLSGRNALVNVIPYNPVAGLPYRTPSESAQRAFRDILISGGLQVRFRVRKGDDIDAACGQLRRTFPGAEPPVVPLSISPS